MNKLIPFPVMLVFRPWKHVRNPMFYISVFYLTAQYPTFTLLVTAHWRSTAFTDYFTYKHHSELSLKYGSKT
jgi:hypothetical protein